MSSSDSENGLYQFAPALFETVQRAGRAILGICAGGLDIRHKDDASPVTDADEAAENIILAELARLAPDVPVIAEEAVSAGNVPQPGDLFFLVDPLDGTKEFIRGTGEFTVNIGLVSDGTPRLGVIYAPALGDIYLTLAPDRAVKAHVLPGAVAPLAGTALEELHTRAPVPGHLTAAASRSHMNGETRAFLDACGVTDTHSAGSSLKFCTLAAGLSDVYPRLGPTMEWDTAAGDAILRAAGGVVLAQDGAPLDYGKVESGYLNPGFIAWGRPPDA